MSVNLGTTLIFGQKAAKLNKVSGWSIYQSEGKQRSVLQSSVTAIFMMVSDVIAVLVALYFALHLGLDRLFGQWISIEQAISEGPSLRTQLGFLLWFIGVLLVVNRSQGLYGSLRIQTILNEQRKTVQSCLVAGLLLCGGLYMTHNATISRAVVVYLVCLTTVLLCAVRGIWRYSIHRDYEKGLAAKNVVILGASHMGEAVRAQLNKNRRLGRTFKGFITTHEHNRRAADQNSDLIVGKLCELRHLVRRHFIDEIIIAESCATPVVVEIVELARELDVEVLVIPGFYEDATTEAPIFYLGDFPVAALHSRDDRVIARLFKRVVDFVLSTILLVLLAPVMLLIAVAIKLTSSGQIFYISDRIGRKGRVFHLWKFRTMVPNAEKLKASLISENERDGILFKIKNDPRITPLGRFLRKYSLDELPQIFNVLLGDMSLVGPRPPIASEVAKYELEHYRRLEVLPGLTGLWQVKARHDPSFEQYVALDLAYIENWNLWLDLKILLRTAEVVFRGTGS